jgi:putative transposase
MPPRLDRRQQTGDLHFLTFSCHARAPYLASAKAASIFEHSLESIRQKYQFHIFGYVVMPEHIHLLVSERPTHPLSTVIGSVKRSVSKQLPETPFWLQRYYDRNIRSSDERVEKLRYLHRNPVTRGLAPHPSAYPWSSFNAHWNGTRGTVQITTHWPSELKGMS